MSHWKVVLAAVLCSLLAFLLLTWFALEGRDVVVLRTFDRLGTARETRTWIADDGGFSWIEAATEERPFYRNIVEVPEVEVVRGDRVVRYRSVAMPNPAGHEKIRWLLARKYGWADCWVGLLADTSGSIAIRLAPR